MAVSTPIQTSFNGGKFGPRMKGRVDLQRYAYACEVLQNFIPTTQGPAIKRSGTRFVKPAISNGVASRLIPFEVSDEQAYVIELGVAKMRFYRNEGAVLETAQNFTSAPTAASPVVCTITGHGLTSGDSVYITGSLMTELNGRFFTINVLTSDTFELLGENGSGRATGLSGSAARHHQITDGVSSDSIPWGAGDFRQIKFVQNGDLMYLVHPDYPIHEIRRMGDLDWTCTELEFAYPAFETENITDTSVVIGNVTVGANTTLTASAALFAATDVGRFFTLADVLEADNAKWTGGAAVNSILRDAGSLALDDQIYHEGRLYRVTDVSGMGSTLGYSPPVHEEGEKADGEVGLTFMNWGGYGYAEITGYTNSTSVNATVILEFSDNVLSGNSTKWAFSAWDEINGYPRAVAFYEDRLFFGGTAEEPQTFWGSVSGEYDNFRINPAEKDDTGLQFTLLTDKLNTIEAMQGDDSLQIFTMGGEFIVDSGSASQGITPSNVRVKRRSNYGTHGNVQPRTVDSAVLFVRRTNDLHELTYEDTSARYIAPDLTRYSEEVLEPGAVELSYQPDPFRQVWVLKTDGTLASLTYDKLEDVLAWADVTIGGTDAEVESIAVIPGPSSREDQLWLTVARTIGGQTVRHIEFLENAFRPTDSIEDAFFVDCGSTYDDAPATIITGLWHLEGEDVVVLADGGRVADKTVENGQIELDDAASVVQVGLQMGSAKLQTVRWEQATAAGSAQGQQGRISNISIRVDTTGDQLEYGADFSNMDVWERRTTAMAADSPVPLYTGDSPFFDMPGGWEQEKRVAIRYDEPLPCTIVSFVGKLDTESV